MIDSITAPQLILCRANVSRKQAAIKKAIEEYSVPESQRGRLIAQRRD